MINPLLLPLLAYHLPWPWFPPLPPLPPLPLLGNQSQLFPPTLQPVQPPMHEATVMGSLAASAATRAEWSLTDEHKQAVQNKTEDEVLAGIALASVDSRLAPFIPALVSGTQSYFAGAPETFDVDQWQTHVERYMPPMVQAAMFLAGMVVGMVVMAIILR